ncbi:transglycosylase family protein [Streptomyces sp. ME02-8801-2C]|uniref:transglycosylase family protein n=1 Tax=Streptomyces sp. ME02-8801-2C TaxID=3028680 RepID=UPI0029A0FB34|nr:transglycosylase family protein [Streptomyces sp. ME02-8801-2C]MDX3457457.1 transglycosylase family protein [Streptomyces sp. ME02-8801-2C]
MLSGNGRHRRPRQAPALLVAAGVTGSAMALPLLAASGASAASGATWDRVAECESGGSWSDNPGNGFYGGLQLTQTDWEKYGGLAFAPSADQASRSQQISVGEKILADQGAGAWEACAVLSGLGKDTSPADVDTGVAGSGTEGDASGSGTATESGLGLGLGTSSGSSSSSSADSSSADSSSSSSSSSVAPTPAGSPVDDSAASGDSSGSSKPSGSSQSPSPSAAATDAAGGADSGDSVAPPASPVPSSPSAGTGEVQEGDSSPTDATNGKESDNSQQFVGIGIDGSGSVATPGTGRHRGDAEGSYTVRTGDTLWSIADSLGLAGGWSGLFAENEHTVGTDPNHILPGQTLAVGVEPVQK